MTILVTGAAGFIGFHVSRALCQRGETVVGYHPSTPIEVGVERFVEWYRAFYMGPTATSGVQAGHRWPQASGVMASRLP